jgi:hypothetical protein
MTNPNTVAVFCLLKEHYKVPSESEFLKKLDNGGVIFLSPRNPAECPYIKVYRVPNRTVIEKITP